MNYIAPQTFREWHPIGIYKSIDKLKPYKFQLGPLPLILWFSLNNKPNTMINNCNHLGNSLNKAKIKNGCLICPYHYNSYNETDNFGTTQISNGLIWWSYRSNEKQPYIPIKTNNKEIYNFKLDINIDLITFILNLLSIKNNKYIWNLKKKQLLIKTDNERIIYKYPYRLIINNYKNKYTYEISILPLSINKLRLFITYYNQLLFPIIYLRLLKEKNKFENDITTNNLNIKNYFMFKKGKLEYLEKIYKLYENYMFLNDYTVNQFIINKNYY